MDLVLEVMLEHLDDSDIQRAGFLFFSVQKPGLCLLPTALAHTHTHAHTHAHTHTCTHAHTHTYTHTCTHTHTHTHTWHTYIHTYTHMHTHTYTHTHTHIHTYTHKQTHTHTTNKTLPHIFHGSFVELGHKQLVVPFCVKYLFVLCKIFVCFV